MPYNANINDFKLSESSCNIHCSGNETQSCGGTGYAFSLYKTGVGGNLLFSFMNIRLIQSFKILTNLVNIMENIHKSVVLPVQEPLELLTRLEPDHHIIHCYGKLGPNGITLG